MDTAPRRVAVIGSGVAGLVAAHVAARSALVTLFEADERLGGHADTHTVATPSGDLHVDTGFIVHNERTYPVLLRLFRELGVTTQDSEMSLSVSDEETGLEWAGALGPRGLFPMAANLARPAYLRMLTEIPRFHRRARRLVVPVGSTDRHGEHGEDDTTLREFLAAGRFSPYFARHFVEPLVAAVWSCDPEQALDYPARYLFSFLEHHGMLGVFGSPPWKTVTGGSHEYVERVAAGLPDVRTGTKVTSVLETADGVEVTDGNGVVSSFDAVVVATHPAQALALLAEPTAAQREVLGTLPYSRKVALLHTDTSLLPTAEGAQASWNFYRPRTGPARSGTQAGRTRRLEPDPGARGTDRAVSGPGSADGTGLVVTYDLTRLQRLDTDTHYLVTLGGEDLVDPASVIARMEYEHPLYSPTSVAAQRRLPEAETSRVVLAGAYHGWGFHEDGARSGLAAAERLGLTWGPEAPARPSAVTTPRVYGTTIRHTRRTPFARSFTHYSHTWLVDLDHLPDHGVLGRFEARDHLGDPERSIRDNVTAFLRREGVEIGRGRVLMAADARAFGYCFNPISVFWCHDESGIQVAVVVEVHNTYGDRHAYLVHPDAQGRATTAKQMYVSPFHGTDGTYELAVPSPGDRLHVAVTLRTEDGEVFSASLDGTEAPLGALRAAPAALRGSMLIRAHGTALWLRRLPIRPRPVHHQEGVSPMTIAPPQPTEDLWPGLDRVPTGPRARAAARVARRIFCAAVGRLHVTVLVDGETLGLGGPEMRIHRSEEFFTRVGRDTLIGFGESYLTGAWDADDLGGFLTVLAAEMADLVPRPLQAMRALWVHRPPMMHRNTETNTRGNIAHHYDLSNDLFRLFLDPTLSYSSALFDSVETRRGDHLVAEGPLAGGDLRAAQVRKIERLLDDTGVGEGTRVLEIGTGWGELAIRAAARGATVRTITLSTEQQALARERIAAAGHADRVSVELCDYRMVEGSYDVVLSVEMVEAVGHEYWSTYFSTIDAVLAPGGRVGIQAITMPHDRMLATRSTHTWINKYIFPGGFLPSVRVIDEITRRDTSLRLTGRLSLGQHYAETLRQWDAAFRARSAEVRALGFDSTFERMWHFYLEYSRAGFASGYLDVNQLVLTRGDAR